MPRTYFITYRSRGKLHSSVATLADIANLITGNKPFNALCAWLNWQDGNISPVEINQMKLTSGNDSPISVWTSDFYGNTMEETMVVPH